MFCEILLNYLENNKIIIYGSGNNGLYTYHFLKSNNIDIMGFADIKASEGDYTIEDKICKHIKKYQPFSDKIIIVTPYEENEEIVEYLKSEGCDNCIEWYEMERLFNLSKFQINGDLFIPELQRNAKLKNLYSNNRCFIVGNGPSVAKQDLSVLKNEFVFTVNTGYLMKQFELLNTNFHVFVDSMFFSDRLDKLEHDKFVMDLKKYMGNKVKCFFPYTKSINFIKSYGLDNILDVFYLEENLQDFWTYKDIDFTKNTPLTGTVVLTSVMLAMYMGFNEIYLLGCDCTDVLTSIGSKIKKEKLVTYAWDNNVKQQKRLEKTLGNRSFEVIFRMQYLKFKTFRQINSICLKNGIKLLDCTPEGLLDCIDKVDFNSLF